MMRPADPAALDLLVGPLGAGPWRPVGQDRIDAFAAATGDHQWIHVDPERAATGPYGGTIAHGMLLLSLVPAMIDDVVAVGSTELIVNKGLSKVRFMTPVRAGDRVRGEVTLITSQPRPRRFQQAVFGVTVEIEGTAATALQAEVTFLYQGAPDPSEVGRAG